MSPTDAGRFTDAATSPPLTDAATSLATPSAPSTPSLHEVATRIEDDAAVEGIRAAGPWARPVSPTRVGTSRGAHSRLYNEPANYLG